MKEFGSDFHYLASDDFNLENSQSKCDAQFYANGRQALQALILNNTWKRIWIPAYFCYKVVEAIKQTGILVLFYPDAPTFDDVSIISTIPFNEHDVLLRMNYFGLRTWRDNSTIPISVIEDHSHDFSGEWSSGSNADWCFASLRKTIPMPEGGVLWSPKKLNHPPKMVSTVENDLLSYKRLSSMLMKTLYLSGKSVSKQQFRQLYIETEHTFLSLEKSSISEVCFSIYQHFNIQKWNKVKSRNWNLLSTIKTDTISILQPENVEKCNPFSLILKFNSTIDRESCRQTFLENEIYPATLWEIPQYQDKEIVHLSQTTLSLPCDARYDLDDMEYLKNKILFG